VLTTLAPALLFEYHDFLECPARELGEDGQISWAEARRFLPFAGLVVLVVVADGGVLEIAAFRLVFADAYLESALLERGDGAVSW